MALVTGGSDRGALLRDALRTVDRLLLVARILDCACQLIVLRALFLAEALVVALVFGFLPHAVARRVTVWIRIVNRLQSEL